ncbi:hypothetical protein [Clostridium butyricum]
MPCSDDYLKEIDKYYIEKHVVDNIYDVDDNIFKIAICDLNISSENSYKVLNPFLVMKIKL